MRYRQFAPLATLVVLLSACPQAVWAQNGKLVVHVMPRETYIYADGTPIADAKGHYVCLSPGEHKIDLYNYGFKPESRTLYALEKMWSAELDEASEAGGASEG